MSMILVYEGKIVGFREFCLSEAIKPKPTEYGTNPDFDNQSTLEFNGYVVSYFKDQYYYAAGLHKSTGEVVFGTSLESTFHLGQYTDDRTDTRNALRVFSKVMFVVTQIANKLNVPYLRFDYANPALGSVYNRMVKNKIFLTYIKDAGYTYEGQFEGEHIFKRV
jgi:hypothetical protein